VQLTVVTPDAAVLLVQVPAQDTYNSMVIFELQLHSDWLTCEAAC
jgi:hypothetical protein